ncbi:MAG: UDP-N-acetylmuramoyl-tripeptide--D-alanyl-D-alanine ligase [Anaerolineales bacterium]
MEPLTLILALAWTAPPILRTWRLARLYQIEEYKTLRFWRWWLAKRARWFPQRAAIAMLIGVVLSFVLQLLGQDASVLHFLLWGAIAGVVAQPEPVKEVKKTFVRTPRAMRMLGGAFAVNALLVIGVSVLFIEDDRAVALSTVAILGYAAFLFSPVALAIGNGLLYPVEIVVLNRFRGQARARLAAAGVTVIGVTGSYGKTSTKVFLQHILNGQFKTYATPKSFNTEKGVMRAINEDFDPEYGYDYFIAEMGAYVPGEIRRVCKLTSPRLSIVTAVGPMHLERFGTLENIFKAKYEIVEGVPADGVTFFNGDDERVRKMETLGHPATRVLISREGLPEAQLIAEDVQETLTGLTFTVVDRGSDERATFETSLIGIHNVTNILLVTAVARHLGMRLANIAARVKTLEPADHRLRVNALPNGVTIIDDAYSANPVGVVSALKALALHQTGRRIVITPGMVELGPLQDEENRKLGTRLTAYATDIVLVGIEQTAPLQAGIQATDFDAARWRVVDTFDEARAWFQAEVRAGDAVLFLNDLPDTYL